MRSIQSSEFEALAARKAYTIFDFTAAWCGPCQHIKPRFVQLAEQYQVHDIEAYQVDVDECPDVAAANGVTKMPTFQVWYEGTIVYFAEGADPQSLEALFSKVRQRQTTAVGIDEAA